MSEVDVNINIPYTSILEQQSGPDGSYTKFLLESGYVCIVKSGDFAEGHTDITIQQRVEE